jgi:cysteine desulfurase
VGALYLRRGLQVAPLIHGAGHEQGRRASTENVAGIVGLGEACRLAQETLAEMAVRLQALRDRLHQRLIAQGAAIALNGHPTERLPNTLNVSFLGIDSSRLLAALPEVAVSTGSACHAGQTEPSAVLLAMSVPRAVALGAVRFSLGRWTTTDNVEQAVTFLVERLSTLSSEGGIG